MRGQKNEREDTETRDRRTEIRKTWVGLNFDPLCHDQENSNGDAGAAKSAEHDGTLLERGRLERRCRDQRSENGDQEDVGPFEF